MPNEKIQIPTPFLAQSSNHQQYSNIEFCKLYLKTIQQQKLQIDGSNYIQAQFLEMKNNLPIIKELNYIVQALLQYEDKQKTNVEVQTTKSIWISQSTYTANNKQTKRRLYQVSQQLYQPKISRISNLLQSVYKYLHQTYLKTSSTYTFKYYQADEELEQDFQYEKNYLLYLLKDFYKEQMA